VQVPARRSPRADGIDASVEEQIVDLTAEVVECRRRDDDLWDAVDVARFIKTSRSWVYMRVERDERQ
jgi:hypothetical protein